MDQITCVLQEAGREKRERTMDVRRTSRLGCDGTADDRQRGELRHTGGSEWIARRGIVLAVVFLMLLLSGVVCAGAEIQSVQDLNQSGRKVGVSMGSAAELAVRDEIPDATIEYYTNNTLGYTGVVQGKLDAFV